MKSDLIVNCLPYLISEKFPGAFALCGVAGLLNIDCLLNRPAQSFTKFAPSESEGESRSVFPE